MGFVAGQHTDMPEDGTESSDVLLKERLALNEAIGRDLNTTRADRLHAADTDRGPQMFWCECSRAICEERVAVNQAEWRRVRSDPHLFFIAEGHEDSRISRVVEQTDRFWVVEKTDRDARDIVERTDPVKYPLDEYSPT